MMVLNVFGRGGGKFVNLSSHFIDPLIFFCQADFAVGAEWHQACVRGRGAEQCDHGVAPVDVRVFRCI